MMTLHFIHLDKQYYRKTKYPDKVIRLKLPRFVRIFLFCSVGIKSPCFPTVTYKSFHLYIFPCLFIYIIKIHIVLTVRLQPLFP